jgi:hypothetical protein
MQITFTIDAIPVLEGSQLQTITAQVDCINLHHNSTVWLLSSVAVVVGDGCASRQCLQVVKHRDRVWLMAKQSALINDMRLVPTDSVDEAIPVEIISAH